MSADGDGDDDGAGAGRREVAWRLFAAEFDDATFSYSEGDEERAPNYVVSPSGARVNRVFAVGVLTAVEQVGEDVLRARVADPTGAFVVYAGQYQPDPLATLERLDTPTFVAVTGKARTFQPEDGDVTYTSIRPESVNEVDADTRDRWVVTTAEHTLRRASVFADALDSTARGDGLREGLLAEGVDVGLAAGIPRAITEYGTTGAYLAELADLSLDAVRVVAGTREEVEPLSRSPGEGGDASLPVDAAAVTPGGADAASVDPGTGGGPADDDADGDDGTTADEATTTADEAADDEATTTADEAVTPAGDDETPGSDAATTDPTASTGAETEAASAADSAAASPDADDGGATSPDAGPSDADRVGVESADAESPVTESPEAGSPDTESPTAESAGTPGDDGGESAAPDVGDEMYELDEEERAEVEQNFPTEFSSGDDIPDAGEAGIETPDPQTAEDESGEPQAEAAGDEEDADAGDDATGDEEDADAGGVPEDLESVVVDRMRDLDDGDGADREALVSSVVGDYAVTEADVEDAVQDALMSGRCFEKDDDTLQPI